MSNGNESRLLAAVKTATDFCGQQISLAVVLVGLTLTFNARLVPAAEAVSRTVLLISWIILFSSILFGLGVYGSACWGLADTNQSLDVHATHLRYLALGQSLLLWIGIVLLLVAVVSAW